MRKLVFAVLVWVSTIAFGQSNSIFPEGPVTSGTGVGVGRARATTDYLTVVNLATQAFPASRGVAVETSVTQALAGVASVGSTVTAQGVRLSVAESSATAAAQSVASGFPLRISSGQLSTTGGTYTAPIGVLFDGTSETLQSTFTLVVYGPEESPDNPVPAPPAPLRVKLGQRAQNLSYPDGDPEHVPLGTTTTLTYTRPAARYVEFYDQNGTLRMWIDPSGFNMVGGQSYGSGFNAQSGSVTNDFTAGGNVNGANVYAVSTVQGLTGFFLRDSHAERNGYARGQMVIGEGRQAIAGSSGTLTLGYSGAPLSGWTAGTLVALVYPNADGLNLDTQTGQSNTGGRAKNFVRIPYAGLWVTDANGYIRSAGQIETSGTITAGGAVNATGDISTNGAYYVGGPGGNAGITQTVQFYSPDTGTFPSGIGELVIQGGVTIGVNPVAP